MSEPWDSIQLYLTSECATILDFRDKVQPLFEALLAGKTPPLKRRPAISLRLICNIDVPTKLIVTPRWDNRSGTVHVRDLDFTLLAEKIGMVRGKPVHEYCERLRFSVRKNDSPRLHMLSFSGGLTDTELALNTLAEFVADHNTVLARSHDNCCVCGRGLTDELSRSRGIGPECIKHIPFFVFEGEGGRLVQAETS